MRHILGYSAPEHLKNPTAYGDSSIDVYSYGMISFEIITKTKAYSEYPCTHEFLKQKIINDRLLPQTSHIDKIERTLKQNSSDSRILHELKGIVYQCWETKPEDRPKMFEVKQRLDQLQINKRSIDREVELLIKRRNLKSLFETHTKRKVIPSEFPSKQISMSSLHPLLVFAAFLVIAVVLSSMAVYFISGDWHSHNSSDATIGGGFLVIVLRTQQSLEVCLVTVLRTQQYRG